MGRGFMFSYEHISKPTPIGIDALALLKRGFSVSNLLIEDGVKHNEFELSPVPRCPSNYGYEESSIDPSIKYVVDNENCDPTLFAKTGLRAISLRDVSIPEDNHIATWLITTDGYVRENEEYGIIGYITSIAISEKIVDDQVKTEPESNKND